jgi:hypothetical protein
MMKLNLIEDSQYPFPEYYFVVQVHLIPSSWAHGGAINAKINVDL